jgi:hypothetical protein
LLPALLLPVLRRCCHDSRLCAPAISSTKPMTIIKGKKNTDCQVIHERPAAMIKNMPDLAAVACLSDMIQKPI